MSRFGPPQARARTQARKGRSCTSQAFKDEPFRPKARDSYQRPKTTILHLPVLAPLLPVLALTVKQPLQLPSSCNSATLTLTHLLQFGNL